MMKRTILFVLAIVMLNVTSNAQTFVDIDATGSNNGTSWTNAYTDLQDGINAISTGEIWIAEGTYLPTEDASGNASPSVVETKVFRLYDSIQLYGGFVGTETLVTQRDWENNLTILSGKLTGSINAYHVVGVFGAVGLPISSQLVVDGLIIEDGQGGGTSTQLSGAGLYMTYSSAIFQHCTIRNNAAGAGGQGGGAYLFNGSPQFLNCKVYGNTNFQYDGGGFYLNTATNVKILNCLFYDNICWRYGGAICMNDATSEISNCTFSKNGSAAGHAMTAHGGSTANVNNSIFKGNSGSGTYDIRIYNSAYILYYNNIIEFPPSMPGGGNMTVDPLLTDIANNDYTLTCASPAFDGGKTSGVTILSNDLSNQYRVSNIVDIGAYELRTNFNATATTDSVCLGDSLIFNTSGGSSVTWDSSITSGVAYYPTGSGTYTATGTDTLSGCTISKPLTVAVTALTVTIVSTEDTMCLGRDLTLTASGADSYSWDNGVVNGVPFTPASTLTYTVTGTTNGCPDSAQVSVIVADIVDETLTTASDSVCSGDSTTIDIANSVLGISYSLRDSATNIIDGPIAGTGSGLQFNTGAIDSTTTYNVYGEALSSIYNYGLDFDGVNDYVNAGAGMRGMVGGVTVSAWIKTSSVSTGIIVGKYTSGQIGFYLFTDANGYVQMAGRLDSGPGGSGFSTTAVNDNQWHYVTGFVSTYTGVWNVYVDGILENTASSTAGVSLNSFDPLLIGTTSALYFDGLIDQVSLFNTELTASQIQNNMTACLDGSETGLVGLFKMDEAGGTTLVDLTGGGNGTLTNMVPSSDWVEISSPSCSDIDCSLEMTQTSTVTAIPSYNLPDTVFVCSGDNYTFPDASTQNNITAQVIHTSSFLVSGSSCDSIIITTVNVSPFYNLAETDTICQGDDYTFPDGSTQTNIPSPVTYTSNLVTAGTGCDSIIVTTLVFTITDETVSGGSAICVGDSVDITIAGSETGVGYYLRDHSDSSIIEGPITGTGGALNFNTGALNDTTTFHVYAETGGFTRTALDFDGANDYVLFSNNNRGVTNQITVAAWIKSGASGATQFISGKYDGINGFLLYFNATGKAGFDGRDGGGYKSSGVSTTSVNDNQWHYVVGTINVSTGVWSIYVDGALENSASTGIGSSLASTTTLTVGAHTTLYFTGSIDEYSIWNSALDLATIQNNMNNGVIGNEPNIVAHFQFDEGAGTVLGDLSATSIDGTLTNMDPSTDWVNDGYVGCAVQMTQTATVNVIPDYNLATATTVCTGGSYSFPDGFTETNITAQVVHTSNLVTVSLGCDSIVTITVDPITAYNLAAVDSVCDGGSYTFPDGSTQSNITAQVVQTSNLFTVVSGCDSNIVTTVNPIAPYNLAATASVCPSDSYTFPDGSTQSNITVQVVQTSNLTTVLLGCDSNIVTTVNVNPDYNLTETGSVCSGQNYTFPDGSTQTNITAQVVYTSNLTSSEGCDSTIVTTVNIVSAYNVTETSSVCDGGSYTFPDGSTQTNITTQVIYTSTLTSVGGCDSIVATTVNVNPLYSLTETDTVCNGSSYTFPDGSTQNNITTQVVYTSNLFTVAGGCDSIIVTTVNVNPSYNMSETVSVCDGGNYTFPDGSTQSNITAQVTYTSNLFTVDGGCDSSIITTVTIDPVYNLTESASICTGQSYTFPDGSTQTNITAQVIYTSTLSSSNGCDSVIVTTVDIVTQFNTSESTSICSGANYTFPDGTTQTNITSQVVYTSNLISSGGCDSIVVTTVTISGQAYNLTEGVSVCEGDAYTFPDGTTQSNVTAQIVYTSNLTTVGNGCDSIIVTTVDVYPTYNSTPSIDVCSGSSYTFPDGSTQNNITSSVVYTSNLQTVAGCDSIIITSVGIVTPLIDNTTSLSTNTITVVDQSGAGATYQWLDCDNGNAAIPNETGVSFTPSANGNYAVEITLNGCVDNSSCMNVTLTGINEVESFAFHFFPNPALDLLNIVASEKIENITIYNIEGGIVKVTNGSTPTINVSKLPHGMYILRVQMENEIVHRRFNKL